MIALQELGKSYGPRTLFEGVSLQLNVGNRYGLVGANGSGKSTLLKILAGDESATEGTVSIPKRARLGVLRQDHFAAEHHRILDVAMMGDNEVWAALEQKRAILEGQGDPVELAECEERIGANDGYTLEARAGAVLEGLGIETAVHERPLSTLSGGFKLRVLLAQVLLGRPDALLLDEPTNHLDILSIRWLEKFLANYRGCAVVISHDVRFLDNIATHILDVDYETVTVYTGNYTRFLVEKAAEYARKETQIERQEKIIEHKRSFVERFGAKATKAKQAQSRLKQIEKIVVEELADTSRRAPKFRFTAERPSGKDVLELKGISKSYGERQVLSNVSLNVRRGEKVAILGPNGIGKSTLLKIAMDKVTPDEGTTKWGHETRVGYFAQDHRDVVRDDQTPLSFLWDICPSEGTAYVRGQLGMMLFSKDDVEKRCAALSGGEAARLVFARIIVEQPNVLVLDEPTNHLDIESIEALVAALKTYDGTVIFVSHDRWFVSQLATRVIEVTKSGPRDFPGTYAEYLSRCGDDHLDGDTVALRVKREQQELAGPKDDDKGAAWEEQKRKKNRGKELLTRRDKVTAAIDAAEKAKKKIHDAWCEDGFYEKTPADKVRAIELEEQALSAKIDALVVEWEAIETELATLG